MTVLGFWILVSPSTATGFILDHRQPSTGCRDAGAGVPARRGVPHKTLADHHGSQRSGAHPRQARQDQRSIIRPIS